MCLKVAPQIVSGHTDATWTRSRFFFVATDGNSSWLYYLRVHLGVWTCWNQLNVGKKAVQLDLRSF